MQWYIKCLKRYANFKGRARRKEYWMFTLFDTFFTIIFGLIHSELYDSYIELFPIPLIYVLATLLPRLAVTVRRLHDTGRSGLYIFTNLIPVIGFIMFFSCMVENSDPKNEYGEDPKEEANELEY